MKRLATGLFIAIFMLSVGGRVLARRGNPAPNNNPKLQYYIVDSDDNDPRTPTYGFTDTAYDPTHWHRLSTLGSGTNDDGSFEIKTAPDSIVFWYFNTNLRLPPRYISTNGLMKITIDTFYVGAYNSAANTVLPISAAPSLACPMWGDLEFRTTGDSSKVFYRMTTDSCYVTYYNVFLKGTNGKVRATFQTQFAKADSSVTMEYRSFDGTFAGQPAAMLFEQTCTIGLQNYQTVFGTTYLDRGYYYAKSYSSAIYAKDLHNQLSVKFIRVNGPDFIRVKSIDWPPYDGYEMSSNQFAPEITVTNLGDQSRKIYLKTKIVNLSTNVPVYNLTDSDEVSNNSDFQFTRASNLSLTCGRYRLTATISTTTPPATDTDGWTPDNIMTRDFVFMNTDTPPVYDDFISLDPCAWHLYGATWASGASDSMIDQPGPISSGSVVLDRRDIDGNKYYVRSAADSMVTAPMNLANKTGVWMTFSYQRSSAFDSTIAGITSRTLSGPEPFLLDSNNNLVRGDSLVIEGLKSSGPEWNTVDSNWAVIGSIRGGIDIGTQVYRLQIPSAYLHNHSRFRIRLAEKNDIGIFSSPPFDDDDSWIIDGFELNYPTGGQTDLMPYNVDLGNKLFTHIPRTVKNLVPQVKIGSNALQTNLAAYNERLILTDALNRQVYHQLQTLYTPAPHGDTTISFPNWEIEGAQGGTFTCKTQVELNFNEIRRQNDTIVLYRKLVIDSTYAYDDGAPDTSGSMVAADSHFFWDFQPIVSDSLRGFMFYHLSSSGTTNWTVTIRGSGSQTVASRSFTYDELNPGWIAGEFAGVYLSQDSTYRIEFNMTQGYDLGGDASRGLVWPQRIDQGPTKKYNGLYPSILTRFRDNSSVPYLTVGGAAKNGDAGGPLLPMVRFIFKGSATYLPVDLASFSALRDESGEVSLAFQTAHEQDVQRFEIERQMSGDWQTIASVTAQNSALGANYAALDVAAPPTRITYRLSEVDLDGSRKIAGYANADPFGSTVALGVSVLANPATNRIELMLSGVSEPAKIIVYDMLGKVVLTSSAQSSGTVDLEAGSLAAGSYIVQVVSGGAESRASVIVQK